jgi:uncharacterized protein YyaL (SSP411 family)
MLVQGISFTGYMGDPRDRNLIVSSRDEKKGSSMTGGKPNRLIHEKSPYLLQHAYNPVDWYPWGKEAFRRAKAEDKPVFLSIGYSTCHWCHVMARESFENLQVAALMNTSFVNIKLDREERPEIDHIYMAIALELMGTGGWPLTIVMTPDQRPFFAATYIPRESGLGLVGLLDLIPMIDTAWRERREELLTAADKVTVLLRVPPAGQGGESAQKMVARTLGDLRSNFDPEYGGFGGPPKFPTPHSLIFLIRTFQSRGDPDLLSMAEKTLRAMYAGGIYDHAGFGFHRYSMDASWHVPHFEKMLYDQALLAMAYTEAFRVTGQARYRAIAGEIFTYMIRDLRGTEGAFYSAEDAESGGKEGAPSLQPSRNIMGFAVTGIFPGMPEAGIREITSSISPPPKSRLPQTSEFFRVTSGTSLRQRWRRCARPAGTGPGQPGTRRSSPTGTALPLLRSQWLHGRLDPGNTWRSAGGRPPSSSPPWS